MANNRMWLVHDGSKQMCLLAKFWPTDGWVPWDADALSRFLRAIRWEMMSETEPRIVYETDPGYDAVAEYKIVKSERLREFSQA